MPTDQIVSIRYDGQSAAFPLAESRENGGQLAEAAELFKKAAAESDGKPFPHQAALFREAQVLTELAMIEPDRMKDAKDKLAKFVQTYAAGRHIVAACACRARLQLFANDFAGAEATIAALAKLPRAAEQAAVLRTKILAKQGKHEAAIAELDRLIETYPKGTERLRAAQLAKAENLAGAKKYKEAESLLRDVILATPPEDAAAQCRPTTPSATASASRPPQGRPSRVPPYRFALQQRQRGTSAGPAPYRRAVSPAQTGRSGRRIQRAAQAGVPTQPLVCDQIGGTVNSRVSRAISGTQSAWPERFPRRRPTISGWAHPRTMDSGLSIAASVGATRARSPDWPAARCEETGSDQAVAPAFVSIGIPRRCLTPPAVPGKRGCLSEAGKTDGRRSYRPRSSLARSGNAECTARFERASARAGNLVPGASVRRAAAMSCVSAGVALVCHEPAPDCRMWFQWSSVSESQI